MARDDIIRMAQECQLIGMHPHLDGMYQESLERFAALIAAAEREACAKVAEERFLAQANCTVEEMYELQKKVIAEAIRARGQ